MTHTGQDALRSLIEDYELFKEAPAQIADNMAILTEDKRARRF
jgi:hypothetical protein